MSKLFRARSLKTKLVDMQASKEDALLKAEKETALLKAEKEAALLKAQNAELQVVHLNSELEKMKEHLQPKPVVVTIQKDEDNPDVIKGTSSLPIFGEGVRSSVLLKNSMFVTKNPASGENPAQNPAFEFI